MHKPFTEETEAYAKESVTEIRFSISVGTDDISLMRMMQGLCEKTQTIDHTKEKLNCYHLIKIQFIFAYLNSNRDDFPHLLYLRAFRMAHCVIVEISAC